MCIRVCVHVCVTSVCVRVFPAFTNQTAGGGSVPRPFSICWSQKDQHHGDQQVRHRCPALLLIAHCLIMLCVASVSKMIFFFSL